MSTNSAALDVEKEEPSRLDYLLSRYIQWNFKVKLYYVILLMSMKLGRTVQAFVPEWSAARNLNKI